MATVTGGTVAYTYDAAGNKLRRISTVLNNTTDYISGIQYDGATTPALSFIQTEEGKAVPNGTGYDYQYYLGDNLGNTRVTFGTKTGAVVSYQTENYMPFGMEINSNVTSPKNEYLYNKKELQEELGQYDYGARFYDPVIGRWTSVDPKSEVSRRYSPYTYGDDNSVRNIDPDGMETEDANGEGIGGGCCGTLPSPSVGNIIVEGLKDIGKATVQGVGTLLKSEAIIAAAPIVLTVMLVAAPANYDHPGNNYDTLPKSPVTVSSTDNKPSVYAPNRTLPRDPETGKAVPDANNDETPINAPHTQLGDRSRAKGATYPQGRTFDEHGNPVKDIHHTDHGRPQTHTNPHQHRHTPNPSGTPQRGPAEPLTND